jgi:hypothetical protein
MPMPHSGMTNLLRDLIAFRCSTLGGLAVHMVKKKKNQINIIKRREKDYK